MTDARNDATRRPRAAPSRGRTASAPFAPPLVALGAHAHPAAHPADRQAVHHATSTLPPVPQLPVDGDQRVGARLDLALATPAALVVRARLEPLPGAADPAPDELSLVVPRAACAGGRPLLSALLDAARAAIARATRGGSRAAARLPARLIAWVGGRPHLLGWVGLAAVATPAVAPGPVAPESGPSPARQASAARRPPLHRQQG